MQPRTGCCCQGAGEGTGLEVEAAPKLFLLPASLPPSSSPNPPSFKYLLATRVPELESGDVQDAVANLDPDTIGEKVTFGGSNVR